MRVVFARPGLMASPVGRLLHEMEPSWELLDTSTAPLSALIPDADVVCPVHEPLSRAMLATGGVRLVQQLGVGTDGIDLAGARGLGIPVANIPARLSGIADAVAELAIAFTISLVRRIDAARQDARDGRLAAEMAPALRGRTVLIVGLGDVGSAVARRLSAFSVHVTAIRADAGKGAVEGVDRVRGRDALPEEVAHADVVILCAPPSTAPLLDRSVLARMRPGSFLVNVGRASLVDEQALLDALDSGSIAGAALDVLQQEPPRVGHPLVTHPSVMVTPHIGGETRDAGIASARLFVENVRRLGTAEGPRWVRN